jgi:hypothetical protein
VRVGVRVRVRIWV